MSFEPVLLAPEPEVEEIYPYRRVWRTAWSEVLVLFGMALALYALTDLFGVLPGDLRDPLLRMAVALLPLALWLVFSYGGERRALRPRLTCCACSSSALVANAVAVPLRSTSSYQTDGCRRRVRRALLGYTLTIGFTADSSSISCCATRSGRAASRSALTASPIAWQLRLATLSCSTCVLPCSPMPPC